MGSPPPSPLVLEIDVPDGATEEEVADLTRRLVGQLDDLNRSLGGHGLTVEDLQITTEAEVPAEVLS